MKKLLIILSIFVFLLLSGTYMIIPRVLHISESATISSSLQPSFRSLANLNNWNQWLPGSTLVPSTSSAGDAKLLYGDDTLYITKQLYNNLIIAITQPAVTIETSLLLVQSQKDSLTLIWTYSTSTSLNPVSRLVQYQRAVNNKKKLRAIMDRMQAFLEKDEHLYGLPIEEKSIKDSVLVSTSTLLAHKPQTSDIYRQIDKLQQYLQNIKGEQTGYPMVNISPMPNQQYKLMVALPTRTPPAESGDIVYRRMVPGRFLTTTVKGGNSAIENAYVKLQQYMEDHQRVSPGVPFQMLVTDRRTEQDTAKWVTHVYFPVM